MLHTKMTNVINGIFCKLPIIRELFIVKYRNESTFVLVQEKDNILICPLNWGLGHATRDVPIIKKIIADGHHVIIGGDGYGLQFLKEEFPNIECIEIPGIKISYARKPFFLFWLLLQLPFFGFSMIWEHHQLKKLIKKYQINKIISDNRYGLWNKKIKSIIITHQVFIQLPKSLGFLSWVLHAFTRVLLSKFDECWIPDYKKMENSLAGKLSHGKKLPKNAKYVGALSRFQNFESNLNVDTIPDVLAIISGPEPHRTLFEKDIEQRYQNTETRVLMVCGKPNQRVEKAKCSNIKKVNHLSSQELYFYLKNSPKIIARSGYSTLMDLHVLEREAELIPTPGQAEQEYLFEWYKKD